jgi:hypothetical protein
MKSFIRGQHLRQASNDREKNREKQNKLLLEGIIMSQGEKEEALKNPQGVLHVYH